MTSPEPVNEIDQIDRIDDLEFERRTLDAIRQKLGLGGLARFLTTYSSGKGDYTAERHQWLDSLKMEDILRDIDLQAGQPFPKE